MKTESTTERARGAPLYSALSAGDTIQRSDLFRADDGRMLEMDNLGRLLGVRVLGETLKRGGDWFRPMPNVQAQRPLADSDAGREENRE